jgi:uncharacterized protein YndB with AHSA1/START domain
MADQNETNADREIELTRVFDAPRDLVWKAWTEPEHLAQWWGPQGFTTTTYARELKPGGVWRYVMHGPDGRNYENISTFLEVVPSERLSYQQGGDGEPVNFLVTVTFEKVGDNKTKLTMKSVFTSKDARDLVIRVYNALEGGKQHLTRLGEHLQTMGAGASPHSQPFVITRVFSIPLERMWNAWTAQDQLKSWFGPQGVAIPHCTLDLKPGGMIHYCLRGADGNDIWGKWTFREIARPDRLEFLVSFADEKANAIRAFFNADWPLEMLAIVTFAHHAGIGHGTVVRLESTAFNATDAEQKVFDSGHDSMRQGWTGTFDCLAEFLASK